MRTGSVLAAAVVALALSAAPAGAATGNIFTIVGDGTQGSTGDGGPASAARVFTPVVVSTFSDGSYVILDHGNDLARRVLPDGNITLLAGAGVLQPFNGDNIPANTANLSAPNGVGRLPDGSFLISSSNHHRVRKVDTNGTITTTIGNGNFATSGDGGPATAAEINFPMGIAVRPDGSYLVAEADGNRIRQVDAGGTITTVVNPSGLAGTGPENVPATDAAVRLNDPSDVALTADGGYLIADTSNNRIRKVDASGTIATVAGTGPAGSGGDGGPATSAQLNAPRMAAPMPDGGFVISDRGNQRIRRVLPDGTITTIAGTGTAGYNGDGIPATTAQLNNPHGVAVSSEGDVLVADGSSFRIRLIDLGDPPPPPPPPVDLPSSVTLDVDNAGTRRPGTPLTVAGTVVLQSGAPAASRQIRYAITGANPDGGVLTTDANGVARHTWDGLRDGTDTIVMYADLNNNGLQDAGEPFDRATVSWVLPTPVIAKRANIEPVSGRVLIKLPASSSQKRDPDLVAAQSKFIPLEEARSIPFGSIIDTRAGRAEITSAATTRTQQAAQFYNGNFELLQTKGARPITELRMNEALVCPRAGSKQVAPARARSRQLWGNGKGRFRTRGRNSSASVRGTIWWNKDTCTTTTTVVREGTVIVKDFGKKKNIRLKAPGRYVARAKRR